MQLELSFKKNQSIISIEIMPNLYMIGGANGSEKTTVAREILPYFLEVFEYVNADEIAAGLSPFNSESVAIQAGRLMLERLQTLVKVEADFAFETTLAARNFARFLRDRFVFTSLRSLDCL